MVYFIVGLLLFLCWRTKRLAVDTHYHEVGWAVSFWSFDVFLLLETEHVFTWNVRTGETFTAIKCGPFLFEVSMAYDWAIWAGLDYGY